VGAVDGGEKIRMSMQREVERLIVKYKHMDLSLELVLKRYLWLLQSQEKRVRRYRMRKKGDGKR
jgi:hypothetical protein